MEHNGTVVLVHGLMMGPWAMKRLARALEHHGFSVHLFGYRDMRRSVRENTARLADFIKGLNAPAAVHVIGHSLGGVVTARLLNEHPDVPVARFLALGSPFGGSYIARCCMMIPGFSVFIQKAWDGALDGTGPQSVPAGTEVGVIAGNKGLQHNLLFWGLPKPNDGTVALAETQLGGVSGRLEFPINHNALIWSPRVIAPIVSFLKTGKFS